MRLPRHPLAAAGAALALLLPLPALANLHAGDHLNVLVYNHPELSAQPVVDARGNVSLPLAGTINAGSGSTTQLAARVRTALLPYVRNVAVDVQVLAQSASLFISGGPGGVLVYNPGETLTGAVEQSLTSLQTRQPQLGQSSTVAAEAVDPLRGPVDLTNVKIVRDGRTIGPYNVAALVAHGEPGPSVEPGDTIGLSDKPVAVTVYGAVTAPGIAHLNTNEPLFDALDQVGGLNQTNSGFVFYLNRDGTTRPITTTSIEYSAPARDHDSLTVPPGLHIAVSGNVQKPGDVLLRGDGSLISALYYAGGPNATGDLRNVQVVHHGVMTAYDVTKFTKQAQGVDPTLSDGDTVYVPAGKQKIDFGGFFRDVLAAPFYLFRP